MSTLSDFTATDITGKEVDLSQYEGKAVLVVNTASKCGFTPQYEGLEALYGKYEDQGLVILGFPCDQFGHQEPGSEDEIQEFCQLNYGVSFPMFAKIAVNGGEAHPLYQWLRSEKGGVLGNKIKWNFTKFLIGRDGNVVDRYASVTKPEKLEGDIEKVLAAD
jgi:glutathione peroxidase